MEIQSHLQKGERLTQQLNAFSKVGSCIIIVECSLASMLIPYPQKPICRTVVNILLFRKNCSTFKQSQELMMYHIWLISFLWIQQFKKKGLSYFSVSFIYCLFSFIPNLCCFFKMVVKLYLNIFIFRTDHLVLFYPSV